MSEKHLTLLELHLPDADVQIGPRVLGGSDDDATGDEAATDETGDDETAGDDGGTGPLAAVGLVVLLAAVALALRYLLDDDLEDLEALDDLDDDESL